MYIPNTVPSNLAEMLDFLLPSVQDGLFDSVAYDDAENPAKIVCTQNGNVILEITVNESSQFTFTPYIAEGVSGGINHTAFFRIDEAVRCSGGFCFRSNAQGSPIYYYRFAAAKTDSGKTAFLAYTYMNNDTNSAAQMYVTCFGDNPELKLYNGYFFAVNLGEVHDRTILSRIPVAGVRGSTGCFTTAFLRTAAQFRETGAQIIGGKQYGCIGQIAILDE